MISLKKISKQNITTYDGQLEIDHVRGVVYFHSNKGKTLLRICSLPKPIPEPEDLLDITFGHGVNWK